MNKFLVSVIFLLPALCWGQASQGPATIVYPTTAGDCVKIGPLGGGYLADAGAPCGSSSGGVTSFNTRTGAVTLLSADIPSNAANTSGNAATATALAANPADCSANQFATAIDASGNLTCAAISSGQVSGLGTASTQNTGTSGAVVPLLNAANTFSAAQSFVPTGDVGFILRELVGQTTFAALYASSVTPSATNYAYSCGSTTCVANATSSVSFDISNSQKCAVSGSTFSCSVHLASTGSAPSPSSCGTGTPTVSGTDTKGVVTTGTGATACTLTFASAFASAPVCTVTSSNASSTLAITAVSASAITLGISVALSGTIYYICVQ